MNVREIAATAARNDDFLAGLIGMIDQQHTTPALAGNRGTHQTGATRTKNNSVVAWVWSGHVVRTVTPLQSPAGVNGRNSTGQVTIFDASEAGGLDHVGKSFLFGKLADALDQIAV